MLVLMGVMTWQLCRIRALLAVCVKRGSTGPLLYLTLSSIETQELIPGKYSVITAIQPRRRLTCQCGVFRHLHPHVLKNGLACLSVASPSLDKASSAYYHHRR